jgi:hypothetical protein
MYFLSLEMESHSFVAVAGNTAWYEAMKPRVSFCEGWKSSRKEIGVARSHNQFRFRHCLTSHCSGMSASAAVVCFASFNCFKGGFNLGPMEHCAFLLSEI